MMNQSRWYYNAMVDIAYQHFPTLNKKRFSYNSLRDLMRKHHYVDNGAEKKFVFDATRNEVPTPSWWDKVHGRIPRGAVFKFTSNLNSAIANKKKFEMKKKKDMVHHTLFEDNCYPRWIDDIKSRYWFTNRDRRRTTVELSDVPHNGFEVVYDRVTNRYFLHCPVPVSWFPEEDRRREKQTRYVNQGSRVISLDPGIRKFMVGYDPSGETIVFGEGASRELTAMLLEIDRTCDKQRQDELWQQVRWRVDDLHWKTIEFLIRNYDVILLPDFRIQQMVRGHKLARITKRHMYMFSFHKFRLRLQWKCSVYNKELRIVDESYTSKTCTWCGVLNDTKGKEQLKCQDCAVEIDRDMAGARNIFIKNVVLHEEVSDADVPLVRI